MAARLSRSSTFARLPRCERLVSFAGRNFGKQIGKVYHFASQCRRRLCPRNAGERHRRHLRDVDCHSASKICTPIDTPARTVLLPLRNDRSRLFTTDVASKTTAAATIRAVGLLNKPSRRSPRSPQRSAPCPRRSTAADAPAPVNTSSRRSVHTGGKFPASDSVGRASSRRSVPSHSRSTAVLMVSTPVTRCAFDLDDEFSPIRQHPHRHAESASHALGGDHRAFRGLPVSKQEHGCRARQCSAPPRALVAPNKAETIEGRPLWEVSLDLRSLEVSRSLFHHPRQPASAEPTEETGTPLSAGQRLHSRLA